MGMKKKEQGPRASYSGERRWGAVHRKCRRRGRETLMVTRWEERQPWCVPYASLSGGRKKERRGGSLDEGGVRAAVSPKEENRRGSGMGMRARIKSR